MAFFNVFKKSNPVLMRCTECYYEIDFSPREVRILLKQNKDDPVCPIKDLCDICHTGFLIPVKHTHKNGKRYLFHELKPKIKNFDPDTAIERIFADTDPQNIHFYGFFEEN